MKPDPVLQEIVKKSVQVADATEDRERQNITLIYGAMLVTGEIINGRQFILDHPMLDGLSEKRTSSPGCMALRSIKKPQRFLSISISLTRSSLPLNSGRSPLLGVFISGQGSQM